MIFTRQPSSTNLRYSLGSSEWCFLGLALLMRPTVKVTEGESEGSLLGAGTNRSRSMREGWASPVGQLSELSLKVPGCHCIVVVNQDNPSRRGIADPRSDRKIRTYENKGAGLRKL